MNLFLQTIEDSLIKPSPVHGMGLFSTKERASDTFLALLDGQRLSWSSLKSIEVDTEWNALGQEYALVRFIKTSYYFINHSRKPNAILIPRDTGLIEVRSTCHILPGQELFLDYRAEPLPDFYKKGHGASYL